MSARRMKMLRRVARQATAGIPNEIRSAESGMTGNRLLAACKRVWHRLSHKERGRLDEERFAATLVNSYFVIDKREKGSARILSVGHVADRVVASLAS